MTNACFGARDARFGTRRAARCDDETLFWVQSNFNGSLSHVLITKTAINAAENVTTVRISYQTLKEYNKTSNNRVINNRINVAH